MASGPPVTSIPKSYHDQAIIEADDKADLDSNFCVQTGEEFSTEFLRHPGTLRRIAVTKDVEYIQPVQASFSYNQNCQQVYNDIKGIQGLRSSDYSSDISDFVPGTLWGQNITKA
ncbi:putative serine/threonine protein kinase [Corchorus olitorius]|uniref:Serine/threonine protein kinase n=1 Tax=Corchorus olitorius TaxID=93759 RepID=A0A1R3J0F2_9ROSI|nr:putative serine/threonine protein kinase [Corchorus olitorius]